MLTALNNNIVKSLITSLTDHGRWSAIIFLISIYTFKSRFCAVSIPFLKFTRSGIPLWRWKHLALGRMLMPPSMEELTAQERWVRKWRRTNNACMHGAKPRPDGLWAATKLPYFSVILFLCFSHTIDWDKNVCMQGELAGMKICTSKAMVYRMRHWAQHCSIKDRLVELVMKLNV